MEIGSNNTTLNIDDMVSSLLLEEIGWNNMEGSTHGALIVRDRLVEKGKVNPPIENQNWGVDLRLDLDPQVCRWEDASNVVKSGTTKDIVSWRVSVCFFFTDIFMFLQTLANPTL